MRAGRVGRAGSDWNICWSDSPRASAASSASSWPASSGSIEASVGDADGRVGRLAVDGGPERLLQLRPPSSRAVPLAPRAVTRAIPPPARRARTAARVSPSRATRRALRRSLRATVRRNSAAPRSGPDADRAPRAAAAPRPGPPTRRPAVPTPRALRRARRPRAAPPRLAARRARAWSTSSRRITRDAIARKCARSRNRACRTSISFRYASWTSPVVFSDRFACSRRRR